MRYDTALQYCQIINCKDLSENNAVQPSEMDRTVKGVSHFVARFRIFLFGGGGGVSLKHKEPLGCTLSNEAFLFRNCPCTSYSHPA